MSRKGFAPVIIIVIIALLITAGAFVYWRLKTVPKYTFNDIVLSPPSSSLPLPTESPSCFIPEGCPPDDAGTANWKTYTNSQQKYSFKYPQDWVLEKDNSQEREPGTTMYATFLKKNGNQISFVVNPPGIGLDESYKQEDITIDGKKYSKSTRSINGKVQTILIVIQKPEMNISFYAGENYEDNEASVKVFDQILSTFKFTN